ncbi:MAG: DUF4179 domain-containing protein [Lachnospiraceae bacterium]|nr:DUF4179 domain-containing protein [Lachnospiraceae bacterium]
MNRMEEYQDLMQEIDVSIPELENTLDRAKRKKIRRDRIRRPIVGLTSAFALFVLLVNFCTPVAYACSKIPFIKELAEAVTFSRSLTDAVDNEYVQPIHLEQTDADVTVSVEYLIVDQKQVNIFFRLYSDRYSSLSVEPEMKAEDYSWLAHSCGVNDFDASNGALRSITVDFMEENVPEKLRLLLDIRDLDAEAVEVSPEDSMFGDYEEEVFDYVASFDFLLEFDPMFTAAAKVLPVNQTVILDGNEITVTEIQIYPTHLRVEVIDSEKNSAWLKRLEFYIETDGGMKFETVSNGIIATGNPETPSMSSFRADSSYFYDAEQLKIVFTGAEWLNKDQEKVYVNLKTGETGQLPEGVKYVGASKSEEGWLVNFLGKQREPNHVHMLFSHKYYDLEGNQYEINSWSSTYGMIGEAIEEGYFGEQIALKDYTADEVWLTSNYSHVWTPEEAIEIIVMQ